MIRLTIVHLFPVLQTVLALRFADAGQVLADLQTPLIVTANISCDSIVYYIHSDVYD